MGADHGPGVRPQQLFKVPIVDGSVPASGHEVRRSPLLPQAVQGPQDGVVLQVRGDHMVPRPQQTGDGDVQCHGGVHGEHHMVRPGAAEQSGQLLPDRVHRPGRSQGVVMDAPAAVSVMGHGRRHRLRHSRRLGAGGGSIVQIDHGLTTLPAPASFSTMLYILVTPPTASFSVRP